MNIAQYLSIVLLVGLPFGQFTLACSCLPPSPPLEELKKTSAVFLGEVTAIELHKIKMSDGRERPESKTVSFTVLKTWKGVTSDTIKISTPAEGSMCGVHFEIGIPYLVYADLDSNGALATNLCSRTKPAQTAWEELAELDHIPSIDVLYTGYDPGQHPPILGVVMCLRNRTSEPIYALVKGRSIRMAQIWIDGNWSLFSPDATDLIWDQLSPEQVAKESQRWQQANDKIDVKAHTVRIDPNGNFTFFTPFVSEKMKWRIGCRYITEVEYKNGVDVRKAGRILWNQEIDESTLIDALGKIPAEVFGN